MSRRTWRDIRTYPNRKSLNLLAKKRTATGVLGDIRLADKVRRVTLLELNAHFDLRAASSIDLATALRTFALMGTFTGTDSKLLRDIASALRTEALQDQVLLALLRVSIVSWPETAVELPADIEILRPASK